MKRCGWAASAALLAVCAGSAYGDIIATCRLDSGHGHLKLTGHEAEWIQSSPTSTASPVVFHGTANVEDISMRGTDGKVRRMSSDLGLTLLKVWGGGPIHQVIMVGGETGGITHGYVLDTEQNTFSFVSQTTGVGMRLTYAGVGTCK